MPSSVDLVSVSVSVADAEVPVSDSDSIYAASLLTALSSLSIAYLFDDVERLYQWLIERWIDLFR